MNEDVVRSWRVRPMKDGERIREFSCNDSDLDDYIHNESANYQSQLLATNYLVEDSQSNLLAFFTLLNDRVCLTDFDTTSEFNRFRKKRFTQSKRFKGYPAVKIGRLAVSYHLRGKGIGSILIDFKEKL